MKLIKFFALVGAVVLTFSCSNDESQDFNNDLNSLSSISTTEHARISDINGFALEVSKSNEFKDLNDYANLFYEKFNVTTNGVVLEGIRSQSELDNWMSENISSTQFGSLQEYYSMRDLYLSKNNLLITKYKAEFGELYSVAEDLEDFGNLLADIVYEQNVTTFGMSCTDLAQRCINRAQSNAAATFLVSGVTSFFNPIGGAALAIAAYISMENAIEACMDAFNECIG